MTTAVPATPPAQRGRLRIADRVLGRIAAQAAWSVLPPTVTTRPRVSVSTSTGPARLTLALTLPFPADLRALSRAARRAAIDQVEALTGTRVAAARVVIHRLVPAIEAAPPEKLR